MWHWRRWVIHQKVLMCGEKGLIHCSLYLFGRVWMNLLSYFLSPPTLFKLLSLALLVEGLHIATLNNSHSLRSGMGWLWTVCKKREHVWLYFYSMLLLVFSFLCISLTVSFFLTLCISVLFMNWSLEIHGFDWLCSIMWDEYHSNWSVWHPS